MPAYEGKGQPPVALGWFGGGLGWWGGSPSYEGQDAFAVRRSGDPVYVTGPTPAMAAIAVPAPIVVAAPPAPMVVAGPPANCQPAGRAIAIVIPRDPSNGDTKR